MSGRTTMIGAVIDAIVGWRDLPEFADVHVRDGLPLEQTPGVYLYVGVSDPDAAGVISAATSTQTWPHATMQQRDEQGSIQCAAEAWDAAGDQKAARDAVLQVVAAVQQQMRVQVNLGVEGVVFTSYETTTLDQAQTQAGAYALIAFSITFQARL